MLIIVICFSMEKKCITSKPIIKLAPFLINFFKKYIWKIDKNESKEVSSKGNVYNFSIDYHANNESDILNIHKYLMVKNN